MDVFAVDYRIPYFIASALWVVKTYWVLMFVFFLFNWLALPYVSTRVDWMKEKTYKKGFVSGIITLVLYPLIGATLILAGIISGP